MNSLFYSVCSLLTALYILLKFKLVSLASPPLDPLPPNHPDSRVWAQGEGPGVIGVSAAYRVLCVQISKSMDFPFMLSGSTDHHQSLPR